MNKKNYIQPEARTVVLVQQYHLLTESQGNTNRPNANFMSNPDIGDEEDEAVSSRRGGGYGWGE